MSKSIVICNGYSFHESKFDRVEIAIVLEHFLALIDAKVCFGWVVRVYLSKSKLRIILVQCICWIGTIVAIITAITNDLFLSITIFIMAIVLSSSTCCASRIILQKELVSLRLLSLGWHNFDCFATRSSRFYCSTSCK